MASPSTTWLQEIGTGPGAIDPHNLHGGLELNHCCLCGLLAPLAPLAAIKVATVLSVLTVRRLESRYDS